MTTFDQSTPKTTNSAFANVASIALSLVAYLHGAVRQSPIQNEELLAKAARREAARQSVDRLLR